MASKLEGEFISEGNGDALIVFPWFLAAMLVLSSVLLLGKGMWYLSPLPLLGLLMFRFEIVDATDPPSFALIKTWDIVCLGIRKPRRYLMLPFFPFYMSFEIIPRLRDELTFHFKGIPALLVHREEEDEESFEKASLGGSFDIEIGLAIEPTPRNFLNYILSGGLRTSKTSNPETYTMLQDVVWNNLVQSLQAIGQKNGYEEVIFMSREQIAIYLLQNLTNEHFYDDDERLLEGIDLLNATPKEEDVKQIEEVYFDHVGADPDIDIEKWGFSLPQFKVGPVRAPEELAARAREIAEEQKIDQRERRESKTLKRMIDGILKDSEDENGKPTMSYEKAREEALFQKGLIPKTTTRIEIPGLEKAASSIGDIAKALGGKSNENT